MKEIKYTFYTVNPSQKNVGLKHVLWKITDDKNVSTYDWGFAEWLGNNWNAIEVPEGFIATVSHWANIADPVTLLGFSKIITMD